MYGLYVSLAKCSNTLHGTVKYPDLDYEKALAFELEMTKTGSALVEGEFQEYPHLRDSLLFHMETDQTCIYEAIKDLKQIEMLFGDYEGKRAK